MPEPLEQYRIAGTLNLDRHPCLSDPATYPGFQQGYEAFKELIVERVAWRQAWTLYKFGYGDYLFLNRRSEGSATVGLRALSKSYEQIDHHLFVEGAGRCDAYACEILPDHVDCFREVFGRAMDFPAEYCYAAMASRWVFRTFPDAIGLIGADCKMRLINRLADCEDYRRYLGIERFTDLVSVPQRFACDDLLATERQVARQLENARARLFLVGIGHVKSGLLHRLKRYSDAVFLDVGQGIDALAGIIDTEKPFFGGWRNFSVEAPSLYAELDYLSYVPYAFLHPD